MKIFTDCRKAHDYLWRGDAAYVFDAPTPVAQARAYKARVVANALREIFCIPKSCPQVIPDVSPDEYDTFSGHTGWYFRASAKKIVRVNFFGVRDFVSGSGIGYIYSAVADDPHIVRIPYDYNGRGPNCWYDIDPLVMESDAMNQRIWYIIDSVEDAGKIGAYFHGNCDRLLRFHDKQDRQLQEERK